MNNSGFGAFFVGNGGRLSSYDYLTDSLAVAPAFNLDMSAVASARSAKSGAEVASALSSSSNPSVLSAYDKSELTGNVKFMIENSGLALQSEIAGKKLTNIIPGKTYKVPYTGASTSIADSANAGTGAKLFVAAAIYDSNNNLLYRGELAEVTSASGSVDITIPADLDTSKTYKLALYEEQISGTNSASSGHTTIYGQTLDGSISSYWTGMTGVDLASTVYETDYCSPFVVAEFTTVPFSAELKSGERFIEGKEYGVDDITSMFTVKANGSALNAGDYFFMESSVFEGLSDKGKASVSVTEGVNVINTELTPADTKDLSITFVYYPNNEDNNLYTIDVVDTVIGNSTSVINLSNKYGTYTALEKEINDLENGTNFTVTENGIKWWYKVNKNGEAVYLHVDRDQESINSIIDSARTLVIPSKVNGLTVRSIGGGSADKTVVPAGSTGSSSWLQVSLPSSVQVINDYAFVNTAAQATITIPSTVDYVGKMAFAGSSIKELAVNMGGLIEEGAFGNTSNLKNITIRADGLTVGKRAFENTGATDLTIRGTATLMENSFNNNDGLTALYLPNGVTADAYAFADCANLATLESDMTTLGSNVFDGSDAITTLILDENTATVKYNWNGESGTTGARSVYVKNKTTNFEMHKDGASYTGPFGHSGGVVVVNYDYDTSVSNDTAISGSESEILRNCQALEGNSTRYKDWYTGSASQVTFYSPVDQTVANIAIARNVYVTSDTQTGIAAAYNGAILTTQSVNKDNMLVTAVFGSDYKDTYASEDFYVVRTSDYISLSTANNVSEETLAECEPVTAADEEANKTISVTVVVFKNIDGTDVPVTDGHNYFSTPVTLRVEEYNAQQIILNEYGDDYESIINRINALNAMIESLDALISAANGENEELLAQKAALQSQLATLNGELSALTSERDTLNGELTTLNGELDTLNDELAALQAQYDALVDKSTAEANALKAQIESKQAEIDEKEAEISEKQAEIDAKDTEIALKNTEISNKQAEIEALTADLSSLQAQLDSIKGKLETSENALADKEAEYEALEDKSSAEAVALKSEINSLNSQIDSLNSQKKNVESLMAQMDALTTEIAELKEANKKLAECEAEYEDIQEALSKFSENNPDSNAGYAGVDKDGNDVVYINAKGYEYDTESGTETTVVDDLGNGHTVTVYTGTGDPLKNGSDEFEFYIDLNGVHVKDPINGVWVDYEDTLAQSIIRAAELLQEANDKLADTKEKFKDVDTILSDAGYTIGKTGRDAEGVATIDGIKDAVKDLVNDFTSVKNDYADLKSAIYGDGLSPEDVDEKTLAETLDQLNTVYVKTNGVAAMIESALSGDDISEEDAKALNTLLGQIETMRDTLNSDIKTISDVTTALNISDSSQAVATIEDLYRQIETLKSANAALQANNETLQASKTALETENAKLQEQVTLLTQQLANAGSGTTTDSATVTALRSQVTSLTSENSSLKSQVNTLTTENSNLKSQNSSLTSSNNSLKSDNDDLKSENRTLKSENTTLTNANSRLQSENTASAIKYDNATTSVSRSVATPAQAVVATPTPTPTIEVVTPTTTPTATATVSAKPGPFGTPEPSPTATLMAITPDSDNLVTTSDKSLEGEDAEGGTINPIKLIILAAAVLGLLGTAAYFLFLRKPKVASAGGGEVDDSEFDIDDEDETDSEMEEVDDDIEEDDE
ncbi:MAG: leucine-rich repeat protein [Lachnospiraceae bacterium]|nr:leucine-rich repeat protein [Lachnospiraceae bacterium]